MRVLLATILTLMIAMTFGKQSWAGAPAIPTDALPVQLEKCREKDSQAFGTCLVFISPSSGVWLQFYHEGVLVLIRNVPERGGERHDLWVRDGWNTF